MTQPVFMQRLTAAGCGLSLAFALLAGFWSRNAPAQAKAAE
jgi:hypothetical protein